MFPKMAENIAKKQRLSESTFSTSSAVRGVMWDKESWDMKV